MVGNESKFIFVKLRPDTGMDGKIVISGFYDPQRIDADELKVTVCGTAVPEREIIVTEPSLLQLQEKAAPGDYKAVYVLVKLPGEKKAGKLQLIHDDELLYTCGVSQAKKVAGEVNCGIDVVNSSKSGTRVRGWAASDKKVKITPLKTNSGYEVKWYKRDDIKSLYPELSGEYPSVFWVEFERQVKNVVLEFQCGGNKTVLNGDTTFADRLAGTLDNIPKDFKLLKQTLAKKGIRGTVRKILTRLGLRDRNIHVDYSKWLKSHMTTDKELERQRRQRFEYAPKFSIVVPLYETDPDMLAEMIESVKKQTYGNWELCLSDGSRNEKRLTALVDEYTKKDNRIRYVAKLDGPLGIAENTNQAVSIATGDYLVLGDHDDLFAPDALYECVVSLNENRDIDVIYTDEDKFDSEKKFRYEPHFKSDFNIDLLRTNNYICHMFVADINLAKRVGLFRGEYNGSQDYDFIFRCVEQAKNICHIPKILYHWRAHSNSTAAAPESKLYAFEAGKRAIEAHYERMGISAQVFHGDSLGYYKTRYEIIGQPLISIIIPNKDQVGDLKKCMDSIDQKSDYRNYEYIIVENNSEENETFEYYREIEKRDNVRVVVWKDEFNYSAINNFGVGFARGEYLLLLNNDTEIINEDCISQLLGYCQRDDVGIVGARLYYPDGTIQHGGVIVGMLGIAGHAFVGLSEEDNLYQSRTKVACDYSAVTAACMMVKKSVYESVGGLEEGFKVAFNDVDFCLKVRKKGLLVVYNANARLYHYESKSRGSDKTSDKAKRFDSEIDLFKSRWSDILEKGDPYYNPNLSLERADFSVGE